MFNGIVDSKWESSRSSPRVVRGFMEIFESEISSRRSMIDTSPGNLSNRKCHDIRSQTLGHNLSLISIFTGFLAEGPVSIGVVSRSGKACRNRG